MDEKMYFVAAGVWPGEKQDLSLEGFVRRGTMEDAKKYFEEKSKKNKDKIKLYKLVEIDV
jgi:hypothetical protein